MRISITFTRDAIVVPPCAMGSREIGAVLEFHGVVREMEGEKALTGLSYEAYEPMAEKVLAGHLRELGGIYGCEAVEFIHRLGLVRVGEASLYIRVQSAHRGEGLRFLADAIDRLKTDVPVWKSVC